MMHILCAQEDEKGYKMRQILSKSRAIKIVTLIFALIGILLIFPLRVFTGVLEIPSGGTIVDQSHSINFEYNRLYQSFIAQYDRLSYVDVYITEVEKGRYVTGYLNDENGAILLETYVDTEGLTIPGYVRIPMEMNVEVGKEYSFRVTDCRSKFWVAFEDIPEDSAYIGDLTWDYVKVEGRHMSTRFGYRLPLSKGKSLGLILAIAAVAAIIYFATDRYYKKYPENDSIITVGKVVQYSANPVAAIVFGALMIMVFPLKVFDSRALDIVFYELGLIISAVIVFYAINHRVVKYDKGISFWRSLRNEHRLQYLLIMFSMAMALWYASCYMNDLYDIYHHLSERRMTIWLLVMLLFTFTLKEGFNLYNFVWVIASGIFGVSYYNIHKMADTEKEYDLHNLILKYDMIILVLLGIMVLNLVRLIAHKVIDIKYGPGHDKKQIMLPSAFGIMLGILLLSMVVFRNTRLWCIYLAVFAFFLYVRFSLWTGKRDFYKVLSGGFMMNFAISLIYSYLHRYFPGYVSGRFAFIFHTVTITAEYFTFMGAVATVLLIVKIISLPQEAKFRDVVTTAWKEMTLFGFIMSYAIFTVSRTAYLAIGVSTILVLVVVMAHYKKQLFRIICVFAVSLVLCFPAAFTLQRILPTIAADPVFYPIDDADDFIRGGADWDSTNFMCVERFVNLFESKILGMEVGVYEYPMDKYNYDMNGTGGLLYDDYGRPYDTSPDNPANQESGMIEAPESDMLLASALLTRAEIIMLLSELEGYVDTSNRLDVISNGRITIFTSYLQQLNMWGHEEMGATLPDGEVAVHAHNTFLQVAYDHGIVVGILFGLTILAALVSSILYYKKNREKEPLSLITCAVVIGFAVAGISEWVFQYASPMTVAFMISLVPLTFKAKEI